MDQMRQKLFVVLLMLFVSLGTTIAQQGFLKGKITDKKTGEELVGAAVVVDGTTIGTITDFMGDYTMPPLEAGTYTIRVQYISYDPQVFNNIVIKAGHETALNVQLNYATMDIEEVQVKAKANRESENMLLMDQKKAVVATQAIGAQELSRKGVSDAEGAVTKVSGISKQEGVKNVFVRGLGDRFNSTTLNGFPVPSEDPEYKNISLDFFESDIIKSVDVKKVFNGGMNGDVGGAQININSKELVGDSEFNIDLSTSINSETYDKDFFVTDGVNSLGFAQNTNSPKSGATYAFKNSLDPASQSSQIGKGIGLSGGKRFEIGKNNNPLSLYLIGKYSNDFDYRKGVTRQTTTNGTVYRDQNTEEYTKTWLHFATANVNYTFKKYNLSYNFLSIHTAKQELRDDFGKDGNPFNNNEENDNFGLVRRQQNNDNLLLVNQLLINRNFSSRISAEAGVAYNYINGKEPDRRVNYLTYLGGDMLEPLRGTGNQHRYFGDLKEKDINAIAKVNYKLTDDNEDISSIEFGYRGRFLKDDYIASSWDNSWLKQDMPVLSLENLSLDEIFNQEGLAAGNFSNNNYKTYQYTVDKTIHILYAEFNYQFSDKLILNLGLKADDVHIGLDYDLDLSDQNPAKSNAIDELFVLPSLNLKYSLNQKHAIRLGASKTYTLPQSKEISPMLYEGSQWSSQGNVGIVPSTNYNVDIKWDFYLTSGELISATAFVKLIEDPISKVEIPAANGYQSYANIAKEATIGGVEIEIRKKLLTLGADLQNKLTTGINFSYIKTGINLSEKSGNLPLEFTNDKSELEGASPILINADLSYRYIKNDFEINSALVMNYFSDRIYSIGVGGDYGYNDVEENGLATLDFVSSFKLKKHWKLGVKAKNLLDPEFKLTRKPSNADSDPVVLKSFEKGISLSLGLTYQF